MLLATKGESAGALGFLVVLLLLVVTWLLIRNMNSRLRKLPERFHAPDEPPADEQGPTEP